MRTIVLYACSAIFSIVVMFYSLQLWRADLHIPFSYTTDGDDAFLFMSFTKTIEETGWISHNPKLGAPGTSDLLDYPVPDGLHWGVMKVMCWFIKDYATVFNLYFLLGFPLIAVAATLAATAIGLRPLTSFVVAQIYTFLPFHMISAEWHIALGAYYAVPLTIPVVLWIADGVRLFGRFSSRAVGSIVAFALIGLANPYYTAFAAMFLLIGMVACIVRFRNAARHCLIDTGILLAAMSLTFLMQITPNLIFEYQHGSNPLAVQRGEQEGDIFALRIAQMLLPVAGHRIDALAALRDRYIKDFPFINENETATLGAVASAGFLFLLGRLFFSAMRRAAGKDEVTATGRLLDNLALFTMAALLLGTVGGFGPLLCFLVTTLLRSYNRISIFISFFSLIAVGIFIEFVRGKWEAGTRGITLAICLAVLSFGLFDETSPRQVPPYEQVARDFRSDANFVAKIESSVPAGSPIFQLPMMRYIISPPFGRFNNYQLLRGYLHSKSLRWSFGAMIGREADQWQQDNVVDHPLATVVENLKSKGFAGIYLDRRAFPNDNLERALVKMLGNEMVSDDQALVFCRFEKNAHP